MLFHEPMVGFLIYGPSRVRGPLGRWLQSDGQRRDPLGRYPDRSPWPHLTRMLSETASAKREGTTRDAHVEGAPAQFTVSVGEAC